MDSLLERSFCLSSDASNAFDTIYPETCDERYNSQVNYGIALCKYTGSRGKGGHRPGKEHFSGFFLKKSRFHALTRTRKCGIMPRVWHSRVRRKKRFSGGSLPWVAVRGKRPKAARKKIRKR
ncbi:MAG: hypothetical protein IIY70_03940 [Oscillospiraceae bacterium]|nr:hypothetical protein [Oscillospiraceae bacterium]